MCIMFGKWKMKTFEIVYEPKIEDPVVVARFETKVEAEQYMDMIKVNHNKVYPFHEIVEIK